MLDTLKSFFGFEKTNYPELLKKGAIILDVRSKTEFDTGHIKGAMNIPVNILQDNLPKLKDKNTPVITCCASGMRSAAAKGILQKNGYTQVYNGGGWASLNNRI